MEVFIQNEAGSSIKHIHNEKTLEVLGTTMVSRSYPMPYGFVLDTTAEDGMNVDCFVITEKVLKTGEIVHCDAIGLMEQIENDKTDHNVLAVISGEKRIVDSATKAVLRDFVNHVFDHMPGNRIAVGNFLDREAAIAYVTSHRAGTPGKK